MNTAYKLHEPLPTIYQPALVGMLGGWIDASNGAATAIGALVDACAMRTLATFDSDMFIDYRARRPTMELRDGVNSQLVWPQIELKVGIDPYGHAVLALVGPEPDSAWHRFAAAVTDLAVQLGVRMAVFLGAYPFASPHTRMSRLSVSSPTLSSIEELPYLKNSVDVPAGISAALEHALVAGGVPSIGLWAQVPHYLGAMSYPAAGVALLEGLAMVSNIIIPTTALRAEAEIQRKRVDQLVAANDEHQAMVRQLEELHDASWQNKPGMDRITAELMPSGEDLAAEVERYLREQES